MVKVLQLTLSSSGSNVQQDNPLPGALVFVPEYYDQYGRLWGTYVPAAAPPNTITVIPGSTVRFKVQFEYIGPASSYELLCSLGYYNLGIFNEDNKLTQRFNKTVVKCDNKTTITTTGDVPVPSTYNIFGWKDAYCKIVTPKTLSPIYIDCVNVVEFIPTFSSMEITEFIKV